MSANAPAAPLFDALVADHRDRLYRICRAYLPRDPDAAQDLYQDILVQLWTHLPGFRGEAQLSTWVYRVAVNTAILFQRRERRRPAAHAGPCADRATRARTCACACAHTRAYACAYADTHAGTHTCSAPARSANAAPAATGSAGGPGSAARPTHAAGSLRQ